MKCVGTCVTFVFCLIALSGCASIGQSDYACQGMPEGVRCMSARDVYSSTENADHIAPTDRKSAAQLAGADLRKKAIASTQDLTPSITGVVPVRNPAQVMRVRIFAWEDSQAVLHASEYLFAEIQSRTWTVGAVNVSNDSTAMSPLRVGPGTRDKKTSSPLVRDSKKGL